MLFHMQVRKEVLVSQRLPATQLRELPDREERIFLPSESSTATATAAAAPLPRGMFITPRRDMTLINP